MTSGPLPMPGIAEQPGEERPREAPVAEESTAPSEQPEELLREVRYVRRGPTSESLESSSSLSSTALARGRDAVGRDVHLGYERGLQGRGGYLGDDQGYDPATYWAQGPHGHDGLTLSEDEQEDWGIVLEDMAGEAERADWRRSLDDTESDGRPSLVDMVNDGWRVVSNNLAPHRPEEYRGPDVQRTDPAAPDPDEVPVWMGISSQMPVSRSGRTNPWEGERRFGMTSQLRDEDSSDDGFEEVNP